MKKIILLRAASLLGVLALLLAACSEPEYVEANPTAGGTPATLSSNILFVNASPDAPSLDLYFNNVKSGASLLAGFSQQGYVNQLLPSNGGLANANIRAKASNGSIGGVLGSADLIFRAGNNNSNNFQAVDSAFYTFIAVDSISRPRPLRTNNALGIGDTTYFNPLTGQYIAGIVRAPLPAVQKGRTVAIGTVPLGATDPGGIRFLAITDQLPLPSTTRFPKPNAGKFAVRIIQAAPDITTSLVVSFGTTNVAVAANAYPLSFANFNPSVGSRSTSGTNPFTVNFVNNFADAATSLDIVVRTGTIAAPGPEIARLNGQTFDDRGVYTVVLRGKMNNGTLGLTVIKNK
jgi:hypothetical protein